MTAAAQICCVVLLGFLTNLVFCQDVTKTEIKAVTDETRYSTLHPNATYRVFNKVYNAKGNIIFSSGQRILGDGHILSYLDETGFNGRPTDIEVSIRYPAEGINGKIISWIEIVTLLTSKDGDAFFVNGGGIGSTFAEILLAANKTTTFGYYLTLYGY